MTRFWIWIKKNLMILIFFVLLVFISYANALGNDFVSDDRGLLINVPSYTIENLIGKSYFLRAFQYYLIYHIGGGLTPFLLRLPNILFHMGSVWLIFFLVSRLKNRLVGIFTAALFAVHPILVESVSWIAGGVYVEYTFFFLLSFAAYVLSINSRKWYFVSLLSFVLSLSSSEKAVVFCLVPAIYEICFGDIKRKWKKVVVYFLISFVFLLMLIGRLNERTINVMQVDDPSGQTFYNPLFQVPIAITSYLQLIFWPSGLTLYHTEMIFSQLEYILRLGIFLGFVGFLVYSFKHYKVIFFWLSFFIIALLPTLTPLGVAWIVAERYVYLGSIGIFVVISIFFQRLADSKRYRHLVYIFFSFVIFAFMLKTIIRNVDWQNEDNLWLSAAKTSPSSSQNHNNLGDYYGRHGDVNSAIREFKTAIKLKPNYADAYHNLGNGYRDSGDINKAIESYKKAFSINPKIWQSYQNIAAIYFSNGDYKKALEYIEKGLIIDPQNINLLWVKGSIYIKLGENSKAGDIYSTILLIDPSNKAALEALDQIKK